MLIQIYKGREGNQEKPLLILAEKRSTEMQNTDSHNLFLDKSPAPSSAETHDVPKDARRNIPLLPPIQHCQVSAILLMLWQLFQWCCSHPLAEQREGK